MIVRVTWPTLAAHAAFVGEQEGVPELPVGIPPLRWGEPAREHPGDEETPPSGRAYNEVDLTEEQCDYLLAQGASISLSGGFGPELWPFTEEPI